MLNKRRSPVNYAAGNRPEFKPRWQEWMPSLIDDIVTKKEPHLMVVAPSQVGKTTTVNGLMVLLSHIPEEKRPILAICDVHNEKGKYPDGAVVWGGGRNFNEVRLFRDTLLLEFQRRFKKRRIIILFDELKACVEAMGKDEIGKFSSMLACESAKIGMHLVPSTQSVLVEDFGVNSSIRKNFAQLLLGEFAETALRAHYNEELKRLSVLYKGKERMEHRDEFLYYSELPFHPYERMAVIARGEKVIPVSLEGLPDLVNVGFSKEFLADAENNFWQLPEKVRGLTTIPFNLNDLLNGNYVKVLSDLQNYVKSNEAITSNIRQNVPNQTDTELDLTGISHNKGYYEPGGGANLHAEITQIVTGYNGYQYETDYLVRSRASTAQTLSIAPGTTETYKPILTGTVLDNTPYGLFKAVETTLKNPIVVPAYLEKVQEKSQQKREPKKRTVIGGSSSGNKLNARLRTKSKIAKKEKEKGGVKTHERTGTTRQSQEKNVLGLERVPCCGLAILAGEAGACDTCYVRLSRGL
jgi:hypothetical protein